MKEELRSLFASAFSREPPERVHFAPGRVNLIGEHVDYNQGPVLPAPLGLGTWAAARAGKAFAVRLASWNEGQRGTFDLAAADLGAGQAAADAGWMKYPLALVRALRDQGKEIGGFDLAVAGNLMVGAGLSSSASLLVACARALNDLFHLGLSPVDLAQVAFRAETEYAGVSCGIMDQMAAAVAKPGHALLLDCRDRSFRHVALPSEQASLVIIDSGTRRSLADSRYNERVAECQAALATLCRRRADVVSLRDVLPGDLERSAAHMEPAALRRARHVVEEIERVFAFVAALEQGDLAACGRLLRESHRSLRDLYEVSTPALDFLAERASALPGTFGARLTGAGFGGCVLALTRKGAEQALVATLGAEYAERCGQEARFHVLGGGG